MGFASCHWSRAILDSTPCSLPSSWLNRGCSKCQRVSIRRVCLGMTFPSKRRGFSLFGACLALHVYLISYISICLLAWLCEQLTAANRWSWGTQIRIWLIGSKNLGWSKTNGWNPPKVVVLYRCEPPFPAKGSGPGEPAVSFRGV